MSEPTRRSAGPAADGEPARRVRRPTPLRVDELLDSARTKVVVCCGSGGVGKTTTAAALALRAAERGRRTVVLTIDPARRLAQSLGLRELGNQPTPVRIADDSGSGGSLSAMMLDMRRTFDDMVRAHAGRDRAEGILANPFYQTVSTSFSGTQEYMAMEKLGQLIATGDWDLVVVDTPPSRSALDFLDAPQRLSTALDGRVIRLLSAPARAGGHSIRRLIGTGFGIFTKAISTVVGGQLLADASAFVQAFDSMFGGFRERSESTYRLLRSPGTAFLVVATPEPDAMREASYFVDRLSADGMPLAGLVANRTHPVLAPVPAAQAITLAGALDGADGTPSGARDSGHSDGADSGTGSDGGAGSDGAGDSALAAGVLRLHADRIAIAEREKRMLARFTKAHPSVAVVGVPALPTDVFNLAALREIGARLAGE